MKISVIVAAYNAETFLTNCIQSIQKQTLQDFEIIVVDDCSGDGTYALAQELAQGDGRIRAVRAEKNGGPAAARNIGLDLAGGEWIAIVDSDDVILPQRFEKMLEMPSNSGAGIVFDNLFSIVEDKAVNYVSRDNVIFGDLDLTTFIRSHRRSCAIPNLGFLKPMIRRALLEKASLRYDTSLLIGEDAYLIMELLSGGAKAILMADAYYQYERREGSISSRQNADSIRSITNSYHQLLRGGKLNGGEIAVLTSLVRDNEYRITAKDAVEFFPQVKSLRLLPSILSKPALFKVFIRELGSKVKKLVAV